MKRLVINSAALISIAVLFVSASAYATVKIYLDESRTEYITADELDCKVYEGRSGVTVGFKAGNFIFSVGPEVTLGTQNNIKWDALVQGIIARYKELCSRFNSGAITMKAYNERLKEIDSVAREALEFQEKIVKNVKDESKDAFKELEKETKGDSQVSAEQIRKSIEDISLKVNGLPAVK